CAEVVSDFAVSSVFGSGVSTLRLAPSAAASQSPLGPFVTDILLTPGAGRSYQLYQATISGVTVLSADTDRAVVQGALSPEGVVLQGYTRVGFNRYIVY
ncbi:hypothetical protein KIPB_017072, partial [Kipferlia bialata]